MKKLVVITIVIAIALGIVCGIAFAKEFTDIDSSHWAFKYVDELSNKGIINGYEDGSFRPSNNVTKAEFIKLMVGCLDEKDTKEANDFLQLAGMLEAISNTREWYTKYALTAQLSGLCDDAFLSYAMDEPISRRDMTEVLYNFGKMYNLFKDVKIKTIQNLKSKVEVAFEIGLIKDNSISEEEFDKQFKKLSKTKQNEFTKAYDEMVKNTPSIYIPQITDEFDDINGEDLELIKKLEYVNYIGLLNGYEDSTFKLDNMLTRAEVSTVVYRCLNLRKGV